MSKTKEPWVPPREAELAELCEKWKEGLADPAQATAFGWKQEDLTLTSGKITTFLSARGAFIAANSTANRMIKDKAKKAAVTAIQEFARYNIRVNRLMSEEQKLFYGVRTPDAKPSPVTAPPGYPEADADTSIIRQLIIHFWDSITKKRAKPYGVHGAEILWAILDHEPLSINELIHSAFDTATPFTLVFDEGDRGKRVYFCLRWETTNNLKGPVSEIYSAIIP
jgi:hypothetical protein